MRRRGTLYFVAAIGLAACSSAETINENPNNPNPPALPSGTPVQAASIIVQNDYYDPNSVLLAAGGKVTWNWAGDNGHSVTSTGSPAFSPEAPTSFPPNQLVVTFATVGDYRFFCTTHGVPGNYNSGSMIGTIFVK